MTGRELSLRQLWICLRESYGSGGRGTKTTKRLGASKQAGTGGGGGRKGEGNRWPRCSSPNSSHARQTILYSFFLVLPVPTSRFRAPVLAQMTGGLPRSAPFVPPLRPVDHLLRPCHTFFTNPFDAVKICANLASSSHDSPQSCIFMPNILSQSTVCCLLPKMPAFRVFPFLLTFMSSFFTPSP